MRQSLLSARFLGALSQRLRISAVESAAPLSIVQARGKAAKAGNGGASPASKALIRKIADELRHEEESYKPDEVMAAGVPQGWTVDEKEGDCHLILSRESKGGETVEISMMALDDTFEEISPEDEEEEEGTEEGEELERYYEVPFTVNITKDGGDDGDGLVFDCVTDGESFTIRKCVVESFEFPDLPAGEDDDEVGLDDLDEPMEPYRGPIFENLDPELQERFYDYLEERGVNEQMVRYLYALVFDKEQREYVRWLGRVSKFLESK